MGRTVLMNMLEAHSDYHSASSRIRYYTPLDDSGIASINIMEGYSSARRGMSQPHRPQKDPTLTGYRSEPRPREIRFKVSLAFVLMLFRRKVREATENLRLSPLMNLYLDRWCLHHPARGLEHLIMHLGEVSSNGTSLVTRKRDRSQRAFIQESNAPASSSRDIGFKQALERCLASLEEVLEEARGFSISTGRAGIYFGLIASDMKAQLDRLDLWAVNEVVFRDCGFGDLVPDNAMECVTVALKRITSAAENIRKEMAFLGSLASQGPAEQTGKKIGPGDSLAGQDFIEEIGKDVALLDLLVAENTFADLATL